MTRFFVCAADEVWRLQRGSEADCVFFQRAVNSGARITDRGSRQGTWILAPSGVVLARCNTRNPKQVVRALSDGWQAWKELPKEERQLPADVDLEPQHRWEQSYPEDGLALERIARDLPPEGLDGAPGERWNRDFAWFARAELEAELPADAAVGDVVELPGVALRLARFHLVDNVRGQTLPYAEDEIDEARLVARVGAREGTVLGLELEGHTRADAEGVWTQGFTLWTPRKEHPHGIECELLGRAVYDTETGTFTAFELVAAAERWGRTELNGRRHDDGEGGIAFHFGIARPEARIAPTFIAMYDVDWVAKPAVPTWLESPEESGFETR